MGQKGHIYTELCDAWLLTNTTGRERQKGSAFYICKLRLGEGKRFTLGQGPRSGTLAWPCQRGQSALEGLEELMVVMIQLSVGREVVPSTVH